LKKKQA
jgi:hypothetical protein